MTDFDKKMMRLRDLENDAYYASVRGQDALAEHLEEQADELRKELNL